MEEKGCNVYEKLIILILFFSPFTSINILGLKISEILVLIIFFVSILIKDIMLKKSNIISKFIFIYIFISVIGFCYKVLFISQQSINLNEIIFDLLAYIFIFIASITLESLILASISKVNIHTILKKTYYISTITIGFLFIISMFRDSILGFRLNYYQYFSPLANNIHHVAMYIVVLPFIGIMMCENEKKIINKIVLLFLILSNIIVALKIGSAKVILAWILGVVVISYLKITNLDKIDYKSKKIIKLCIWISIGSILLVFYKYIINYMYSIFVDIDLNGARANIYKLGLEIGMVSPIVGLGPGKHIYFLERYFDPHQTFLLSFLQAGIIGLSMYTVLNFKIIKKVIKNPYYIGCYIGIFIYALGGDIMRRLPCWMFLILFYYIDVNKRKLKKNINN